MAIQRARWLAAAAVMLALAGIGPRAWDLSPTAWDLPGGSHVHLFVDLFDEIYRRGQAQNGGLRTFTATFTETTTSSLLTRPLIARGTVAVERPGRVALRYVAPDDRVVIIDGDRMTLSWPSRGVRQTRDIGASQRRVRKYFVDSSPDELRGHFEVTAREAADRPGYLVTLIPKRKQIKEGLSRLELWIDRDTLLLSAMRMSFPNGDTKLMTYTDVKPNASVGGMFEIKN
jgi:outer membrane lipoprotein-sorting protein